MNLPQLMAPDVPKSGRFGAWIYYMRGGKQVRRPYRRPRDPRTPAQVRNRAAFGAAARAWSEGRGMTQDDQRAWIAAAKEVRSRPRLGQSGPLTGQQYFISVNCVRVREGQEMLLQPPAERALGPRPRRKLMRPAARLTGFLGGAITFVTVLPSGRGFAFSEPLATASSSA
jgi:hypothetical protein